MAPTALTLISANNSDPSDGQGCTEEAETLITRPMQEDDTSICEDTAHDAVTTFNAILCRSGVHIITITYAGIGNNVAGNQVSKSPRHIIPGVHYMNCRMLKNNHLHHLPLKFNPPSLLEVSSVRRFSQVTPRWRLTYCSPRWRLTYCSPRQWRPA